MNIHTRSLSAFVRCTLPLLISLLSFSSRSQDSLLQLRPNIKFSPLHLLNHYSTIQLGYEQPIYKGLTVMVESGYVTERWALAPKLSDTKRGGWKFREDLRYYFKYKLKKKSKANNGKAFYVAYEMSQNYIHFYRSESETVCLDPDCRDYTYVEEGPYKIKYRELASGLKYGFTSFYNRLAFDLNFGLSVHKFRWHFPEGSEPHDRGTIGNPLEIFLHEENNHRKFLPLFGFRVGYHLGRSRVNAQ